MESAAGFVEIVSTPQFSMPVDPAPPPPPSIAKDKEERSVSLSTPTDISGTLLNKVKDFERWLLVNSGNSKERCRESCTHVQKMVLCMVGQTVPDVLTLSNLLETL